MRIVNPQTENTILDRVYPKSQIFIVEAEFFENDPAVVVTCLFPSGDCYTARPISYVATENYVRALSQASYLLAEYVLKNGMVNVDISVEAFAEAAANYELYYRNLAMTFHERVAKDAKFSLKLSIKNAREIKRLGKELVLFTFTNTKTVISGEMSFVYINQ